MPDQETPFFRCRIDGELYEIDKLTLGEARLLRRKYDLADLSSFELDDPDYLAALLYAALSRRHPEKTEPELGKMVDEIDLTHVLDGLVTELTGPDPQTPADEGGDADDGSSISGTTPGDSGDPSSPASTG